MADGTRVLVDTCTLADNRLAIDKTGKTVEARVVGDHLSDMPQYYVEAPIGTPARLVWNRFVSLPS